MLQLLPGSPGKVLLHDGVLALLDVPEYRARVVRAGDGANPSCPVDIVPRHADRQVMVWQLDSAWERGSSCFYPCRSESGSGAFRSRAFEPRPDVGQLQRCSARLKRDLET